MNRPMFYLFLSFLISIGSLCTADVEKGYRDIPDLNDKLTILTPSLAQRVTGKIELDNGLKVYLISDKEASESAASLSMKVGSLYDPSNALGMAHFVEHLLFMGSEAYPEENGYDLWISNHNGFSNAYTFPSTTVYSFSISHAGFPEALDRFAANFIAPLFSFSGAERELCAIEQENNLCMENEEWRLIMVLKAIANPLHPFSQFDIGNRETLKHVNNKALSSWYHTHYSADIASLVIYSPLPLDTLKHLVVTSFSDMPKRPTAPLSNSEPIILPKYQGNLIVIEPLDPQTKRLSVGWELPQEYAARLFESSAHILANYLLMSTDEGSLSSLLKEEGLIESMWASTESLTDSHAFFSVDFDLTPKGLKHIETVLKHFYRYIQFIRDEPLPDSLFEELQNMLRLNYTYQERDCAFNTVTEYASALSVLDLASFPEQLVLFNPFDSREKELFFSWLTPKSALYFLTAPSKLTQMPLECKEPWFGIEYDVYPFDSAYLTDLKSTTRFSFPKPSSFIPEKLTLVSDHLSPPKRSPTPLCLEDTSRGKAYFWQDDRYLTPTLCYLFSVRSPALDGTAKSLVLTDLLFDTLDQKLHATLNEAARGNLYLDYTRSLFKMEFSLTGYSEKASKLLDALLLALTSIHLTPETFADHILELKNRYTQSEGTISPLNQAEDIALVALHARSSYLDKLEALDELTLSDFSLFITSLFRQNYLEAMLTGNLTRDDALLVWNKITKTFSSEPYPKKDHYHNDLLLLSHAGQPQKISSSTSNIGDASLLVLHQAPFSFQHCAAANILLQALSRDFFDELRTKKQLAYYLYVDTECDKEYYVSMFGIHSTSHKSHELLFHTNQFLDDFLDNFETNLSKERFETIRASLINDLNMPPNNFIEMTEILSSLAFSHKGDFSRIEHIIKALQLLSYEDLKSYAMTYFSKENKSRLAITVDGASPSDTFHELTTLEKLKEKLLPHEENSLSPLKLQSSAPPFYAESMIISNGTLSRMFHSPLIKRQLSNYNTLNLSDFYGKN